MGAGPTVFPLPVGLISLLPRSDGYGSDEQMAVPGEAHGEERNLSFVEGGVLGCEQSSPTDSSLTGISSIGDLAPEIP